MNVLGTVIKSSHTEKCTEIKAIPILKFRSEAWIICRRDEHRIVAN